MTDIACSQTSQERPRYSTVDETLPNLSNHRDNNRHMLCRNNILFRIKSYTRVSSTTCRHDIICTPRSKFDVTGGACDGHGSSCGSQTRGCGATLPRVPREGHLRVCHKCDLDSELAHHDLGLKKNLNAPRPSEHPPVRGKKCQNV